MGVISSDFVEQGERGGRRQRIGENTLMLCLDIKIQLPRSLLIILLVRQKKKASWGNFYTVACVGLTEKKICDELM